MTDVLKLSDGVTDCDLMYDSAPGFQLLAGGLKFATPEHENLYHSSEWQDGEQLARHKLENRRWPLKLALKANASDDNIANELIKLNRLVRQARRYWLEGDVDKVYLQISLTGSAAAWTRYATIDVAFSSADIFSYFNRKSGDVKFDGGIGLEVITQPWGYGEEVTLANELGTPHFEEDGDSDGLADQWTESGTPTTTLDTTVYLVGSQSQKVVTDAAGTDGIYSDTVTVSGVDNIASYAWLFCTSGSDEVTLDVQADSTGSIGTATYSAATETDTGANSNIWKRLDVIGSTTAGDTTLTMRVERLTGDASKTTTFYADKTYLQLDATAVPDGWMSCGHIKNHFESATEGAIPYIDVCDILGDIDAKTSWEFESGSNSTDIYIGRWSKQSSAPKFFYWADQTGNADASRTENEYAQATVDTSWTSLGGDTTFSTDNMLGNYTVLAAIRNTDNTTADFRIRYSSDGGNNYFNTNKQSRDVRSAYWQLVDIGPFQIGQDKNELVPTSLTHSFRVYLQMKRSSGSEICKADFYCYMPVDEQYAIVHFLAWLDDTRGIVLAENDQGDPSVFAYTLATGAIYSDYYELQGQIPKLCAGVEQRFILITTAWNTSWYDDHVLGSGNIFTKIHYRPRTEFLLGTE